MSSSRAVLGNHWVIKVHPQILSAKQKEAMGPGWGSNPQPPSLSGQTLYLTSCEVRQGDPKFKNKSVKTGKVDFAGGRQRNAEITAPPMRASGDSVVWCSCVWGGGASHSAALTPV